MAKLKVPFALDRSLNTTEQTSRNIADVLAEELSAIITALGGLNFINYEVVEELPTTEISTTTIYLVPSDDPQSGNTYDEYINLNGTVSGWEKIGSTAIDLSGYYTSAETDALLDEKVDKDSFDEQTATDEFSTINGGLLSSLKVALSPIQDLHGYDSPWVGGSRKNKLPLVLANIKSNNTQGTWSGNSYTYNGVTFTVNTDIDGNVTGIETSGTASSNGSFYLCNGLTLDSGYTLNGCPSTGDSSTYRVRLRYGSSDYFVDTGSGAEITTPVTSYGSIDIRFNSGTNLSGLTFYPMLRLSTESDPTFEPYSNICPISGHTQVEVEVGTNKLNPDNIVQGSLTTSAVSTRCSTRGNLTIPISVGQTITVSRQSSTINFALAVTDSSMSVLFDSGWQSGSYTYVSAYDGYVELVFAKQDGTDITPSNVKSANFMVEFGSTPSPYVPYTKGTYSLTVNLGGTYYSGTLDVVSGVFTPDTAGVVYDGSSDENWIKISGENRYYIEKPSDINANPDGSTSNEFKYSGTSGASVPDGQFYVGSSNIGVRLNSITTLADWKTFLSNNPMMVIYPLATPQTIQLTPQQVKALVGENHFSTPLEGQEITEVKYKKMFTFDDVIAYIQSL